MVDLVERLRQEACGGSNWNALLNSAADEIERLTAERDDLRTQWQAAQHVVEALRAEVEALRTLMNAYNVGGWTDALAPMQRAIKAEAEVEALRAAIDAVIDAAMKGPDGA